MQNRILEIAESPARLRVERKQLVIEQEETATRVSIEDIAALIVAHPQVSYTQAVLSQLTQAGGVFVTCDGSRMPNGILLPLAGNSLQTEYFRQQFELSLPRKKRLWQQLVRKKINMQAAVLLEATGDTHGLNALAQRVQSGDSRNVEGTAAARYWRRLMGNEFRRDQDALDHNQWLNYGYALLRAATSRAIAASGLHPSIGLHHHNRYNAFCLADDLMEPFRPLVDRLVIQLASQTSELTLTKQVRSTLLDIFTVRLRVEETNRSLFDALTIMTSSLVSVILGNQTELGLPTMWISDNANLSESSV